MDSFKWNFHSLLEIPIFLDFLPNRYKKADHSANIHSLKSTTCISFSHKEHKKTMKGHCQDCNRTYVRLDKHRNYMHGDGKSVSLKKNIKKAETEKSQKTISSTPTSHDAMVELEEKLAGEKEVQEIEREEEGGEEIEEQDAKKCRYLGNFPWYFYVPTEFLHGQKANDREYIDMDDHSCQLAHYLNQNSLRWWLKKNCNPITLMSLAYMVHLMNYPQIVQPAHLKPFNKKVFKTYAEEIQKRWCDIRSSSKK